jgi:hypothetical protein
VYILKKGVKFRNTSATGTSRTTTRVLARGPPAAAARGFGAVVLMST